MKKLLWPAWFPYPSSWLSAFILSLLMNAIIVIVRITGILGYVLARSVDSPEPLVVFGILALLLPIPTISFTHHILHRFVGRFIPIIQAPEGISQGLLPGLVSWWEGLYGWLVIALATLTATGLCTVLLPLFNLSYEKINDSYSKAEINIQAIFTIFWIINAANFYQIECLIKRHLISTNSIRNKPTTNKSNLDSTSDGELNRLRGDMGLTQIKKKGKSV